MKVSVFDNPGAPDVLKWVDRADPVPGAGEVVIKVHAAALNYSDLLQRRGTYLHQHRGETVLGIECSGHIAELGAGVQNWKVGDAVCALLPGGGYAERVAVCSDLLLPCPFGISLIEAAALPEAACTVWSNLRDIGQLQAGDIALIHGGAGGIGSMAIQCAKHWGARVITTASAERKRALCLELGAERAVDYRSEDFVAVCQEVTAGRGVDVILDNMGPCYLERNVDSLGHDGRLLMIGLQSGREGLIPLGKMMSKRLSLHTTSLRDRSLAAKARILQGVLSDIWPAIAAGNIRPMVDRVFPLNEAQQAHRYMEQAEHSGKIVLHMDE